MKERKMLTLNITKMEFDIIIEALETFGQYWELDDPIALAKELESLQE